MRATRQPVLADKDIVIGKAVDNPAAGDVLGSIDSIPGLEAFKEKSPLWTYILAEAFHQREPVYIPVIEDKTITPRSSDAWAVAL